MTASMPVWGADTPISLPVPADEPVMVEMQGFAVTQFRLVHAISAADYEALAVPVYQPVLPDLPVIDDDIGIDRAPPSQGSP